MKAAPVTTDIYPPGARISPKLYSRTVYKTDFIFAKSIYSFLNVSPIMPQDRAEVPFSEVKTVLSAFLAHMVVIISVHTSISMTN